MKKFLFCWVLASNLYADNTMNMIEIMQRLEYSVRLILKGFLHNQRPLIDEGREKIKQSFIELQGINPKVYLPLEKRQFDEIIFNNFSRMDEEMALMGKYLNQKNMAGAYKAFDGILTGCLRCHIIVRGW
ncbi:hypothetical protein [Helicobacter sp. 11S02596-1]|uniref:hypothetical protein n=1 Tax=Helicobacter sp. 11S02596-1 TaxID=1476194 RepID=UPI000BA5EFF0|nr:hypothetical protein [Helicobacter sp. 11S02596-1]PAF45089.1 hypothetical protein BJI48_00530 [Helicobacter sp. 11S02596-1]